MPRTRKRTAPGASDAEEGGGEAAKAVESTPAEIKKRARVRRSSGVSSTAVKVFLRVRPLNSKEVESEEGEAIQMISNTTALARPPPSSNAYKCGDRGEGRFEFTQVFDAQVTQNDVFTQVQVPLLRDFMLGHNSVLFAYGCTNAGKTYTIAGTAERPGLITRSLQAIFNSIAPGRSDAAVVHEKTVLPTLPDVRYIVSISVVEIYNEEYYDLLARPEDRRILKSITDKKGRVVVRDLTEEVALSAEQAQGLIDRARLNRMVAATSLNADSSRSHAVYQIKLIRMPKGVTKKDIQQNPTLLKYSTFSIADLAGSERTRKSQVAGKNMAESSNINRSLMTFGKCIDMMKYNQCHRNKLLVPFRESRLTHLFKEYFTGNGRAAMVVCVSPSAACYDETVGSLKFSATAKQITTSSRIDMGTPKRRQTDSHLLRTGSIQRSKSAVLGPEAEDAVGVESPLSSAASTAIVKKLQRQIEELKVALKEKTELVETIEQDTREEMAQYHEQSMREMEDYFEEMRTQELMMLEDRSEQKLEGVMQTLTNAGCFVGEDGDEMASAETLELIERLQREVKDLQHQNHEICNEAKQLNVQLSASEQEREELLAKVMLLEQSVQKAITAGRGVKIQLSTSEMENAELRAKIGELQTSIERLIASGKLGQPASHEVRDTAEESDEQAKRIVELEAQLEELRCGHQPMSTADFDGVRDDPMDEEHANPPKRRKRTARESPSQRIHLSAKNASGDEVVCSGSIKKSFAGGVQCNYSQVNVVGAKMHPAMQNGNAMMESCTTSEVEGCNSTSSVSEGSMEDVTLDDGAAEEDGKQHRKSIISSISKKRIRRKGRGASAKDGEEAAPLSSRNGAAGGGQEASFRAYFDTAEERENNAAAAKAVGKDGKKKRTKTQVEQMVTAALTPIARKTRSRTRNIRR